MSDLLNAYISKQQVPSTPIKNPVFSIDTQGKIKPLAADDTLLPSDIIGNPETYLKDLKKDVFGIGKAAKGRANDHELGRINDLAMKAGSLALATYLFVKNPFKLSKAMEFAGFATFFGAMKVWPKIAIRLPLKLRTGVDIHQEYIDSQGRKKMLFQDPQYVLTDLYSSKDLENIGKKLDVSENLPDRNTFIKERAKKTAIQGNTLWMMTAGIATPVLSALGSNLLEKPVAAVLEKIDLSRTEDKFANLIVNAQTTVAEEKCAERKLKSFTKFLTKNMDKEVDEKFLSKLTDKLTRGIKSEELKAIVREDLEQFAKPRPITVETIKSLLDKLENSSADEELSILCTTVKNGIESNKALQDAIAADNIDKITGAIINSSGLSEFETAAYVDTIKSTLTKMQEKTKTCKLSDICEEIVKLPDGKERNRLEILYSKLFKLSREKKVVDKYVDERLGDKAGSFIANQWRRFCDKLMYHLSTGVNMRESELKKIANSDSKTVEALFKKLAEGENYESAIKDLFAQAGRFEEIAGVSAGARHEGIFNRVKETLGGKNKAQGVFSKTAIELENADFVRVAAKINGSESFETFERQILNTIEDRSMGARASFYRTIQLLDLQKRAMSGELAKEIRKSAVSEAIAEKVKADIIKKIAEDYTKKTYDNIKGLCPDFDIANAAINNIPESTRIAIQKQLRELTTDQSVASIKEEHVQKLINKLSGNMLTKLAYGLPDSLTAEEAGKVSGDYVKKIGKLCKDIILKANSTDFNEKLMTKSFPEEISPAEYKHIMKILFHEDSKSAESLRKILEKTLPPEEAAERIKGFQSYRNSFLTKVANWGNSLTVEQARYIVYKDSSVWDRNAISRSNIVGKTPAEMVKDIAKDKLKSQKWLKIFGITMLALTAITVAITFTFGKKSESEKKAETEKKVNG